MSEAGSIRLTIALMRLPGLNRTEFQTYWRDRHAPLVRALAADLGIERYVQIHTLPDDPGASAPFDGLAEVWFAGGEAYQARRATEEGRAAARRVRDDERRFVDVARSPRWWGVEVRVL